MEKISTYVSTYYLNAQYSRLRWRTQFLMIKLDSLSIKTLVWALHFLPYMALGQHFYTGFPSVHFSLMADSHKMPLQCKYQYPLWSGSIYEFPDPAIKRFIFDPIWHKITILYLFYDFSIMANGHINVPLPHECKYQNFWNLVLSDFFYPENL